MRDGEKKRLMHFRIKEFESYVIEYPKLYPTSQTDVNLRKAVITKIQSVIYTIDNDSIRVLDHRQES